MVLTARHVPASAACSRSLDPVAQLTGMLALAALALALIEGGHAGITPLVIGAVVVFVAATAAFIVTERRVDSPALPLDLFRIATFRGGNLVGLLMLVIGGAGLLGLIVVGAHTPYLLLVAPLIAAGFGMAFTMPAATTAVVESTPTDRAGLAAGTVNAARQVGGVIGVALLGALVAGGDPVIPGLRIALVIAGVAFLVGAAVTMVTVHHRYS